MKKGDIIFYIFQRNCKGTHVGIMLSFSIFIIFLIFLFSIVSPPMIIQRDKSFLLDYLELGLMTQSYADMETFTILIDEPIHPNKDCISFTNLLKDIVDEENLIIKDNENNILNYRPQGQSLYVETGTNFNGFLKIYYSEVLSSSYDFQGGCDPLQVSLGIIKKDTEVFESKIFDLFEKYETDYDQFKKDLNIPDGSEFGFSFTFSNGTIVSTGEERPLTSVYVREVPAQYIDEGGNIGFGYISIRIW